MGLDARGDIAIVEAIVYVPVAAAAIFLLIRHSESRKAAWIYLFVLSISVYMISQCSYVSAHHTLQCALLVELFTPSQSRCPIPLRVCSLRRAFLNRQGYPP